MSNLTFNSLSKKLNDKGYELNRFQQMDTDRIHSDGTIYKYYVSQNGRKGEFFTDLAGVSRYIEFNLPDC